MLLIYKMIPAQLWRDAVVKGEFTGSPVDNTDGFIHFSTLEQVKDTAQKHFNVLEDLNIFAVDSMLLGDALKWEASRGGALFPHLYGSLDLKLIYFTKPLRFDDNGQHIFKGIIND